MVRPASDEGSATASTMDAKRRARLRQHAEPQSVWQTGARSALWLGSWRPHMGHASMRPARNAARKGDRKGICTRTEEHERRKFWAVRYPAHQTMVDDQSRAHLALALFSFKSSLLQDRHGPRFVLGDGVDDERRELLAAELPLFPDQLFVGNLQFLVAEGAYSASEFNRYLARRLRPRLLTAWVLLTK